jgi:hypothetical protein
VDATYPSFVTGTGTLFFVAFVVAVIETEVLGETIDRFRLTSPNESAARQAIPRSESIPSKYPTSNKRK